MTKNANKSYTDEFKKQAIILALRSDSIKATANSLGIPEGTLNTWLRSTKVHFNNKQTNNDVNLYDELMVLRKENARLREEKEILKKAAAYFARESK